MSCHDMKSVSNQTRPPRILLKSGARCMQEKRSFRNMLRHWTLWTGNTTQVSRCCPSSTWTSSVRLDHHHHHHHYDQEQHNSMHLIFSPQNNHFFFSFCRKFYLKARQREMIKSYTTGAYSQTYNAYQQVGFLSRIVHYFCL